MFKRNFLLVAVFLFGAAIIFNTTPTQNEVGSAYSFAFAKNAFAAEEPPQIELEGCGWDVVCGMKKGIFAIAQLFGIGVSFGLSLVAFTLKPGVFNEVMNLPAIYTAWGVVRDLFNIFFILALLFSALSTIFQVQRFHLKKMLVLIVVLALLVNFSWPVTRFIMDFTNVLMTFFLGGRTGIDLMGVTAESGNFANLVLFGPQKSGYDISTKGFLSIFLVIITVFIFAVATIAYGFVLLIRIAALAILLIFSPIGFAASAIPGLQQHASSWWQSLLKYALIGPFLIFMLILATNFAVTFSQSPSLTQSIDQISSDTGASWDENLMRDLMGFVIPIIVLFAGLIAAQKLGDGASSLIVGKARGVLSGAGGYMPNKMNNWRKSGQKVLKNEIAHQSSRAVHLADKATGYRASSKVQNMKDKRQAQKDTIKLEKEVGREIANAKRDRKKGTIPIIRKLKNTFTSNNELTVKQQVKQTREEENAVKKLSANMANQFEKLNDQDLKRVALGQTPIENNPALSMQRHAQPTRMKKAAQHYMKDKSQKKKIEKAMASIGDGNVANPQTNSDTNNTSKA